MAPRCWFFRVWCLTLMLAVLAVEEQAEGESCSAKSCGNLTISYPFWLTEMEAGRSCGAMDFEVACNNSTPILRSPGVYGFAILDITYEGGRLRVVDLSKLKVLKSGSCHVPRWNTSSELGQPFRIDPRNLDLIFYNCSTPAAVSAARQDDTLGDMRCGGNKTSTFVRVGEFYNETSDYAGSAVEGCDATVVPVLDSSGEANASDYKQLISNGFILTWDPTPHFEARIVTQYHEGKLLRDFMKVLTEADMNMLVNHVPFEQADQGPSAQKHQS